MNDLHETLNEHEAEILRAYRAEVVDECPVCGGSGAIYSDKGATHCACINRFRWLRRLTISGVPKRFHMAVNASFGTPNAVAAATEVGALVSGLAKSTFLAVAVKHELLEGFSAYFTDAETIAHADDDSVLWERWRRCEFLAIDDVHLLEAGMDGYWFRRFLRALRKLENLGVCVVMATEHISLPASLKNLEVEFEKLATRMCEYTAETLRSGIELKDIELLDREAEQYAKTLED